MSLEPAQASVLEIAHVLFMDIVGYSKLPMDVQHRVLNHLQGLVRSTDEFQKAGQELLSLPTGDGMALVFFTDAEAPIRCAVEIASRLKGKEAVPLRMGIHTGPVYRVNDINLNRNVAGGGINIAQRVMDCGDAGHVLLSGAAAEVLRQISTWAATLHDLGEVEVKHGARVHLYNFYDGDHGRAELPSKLADRPVPEHRPPEKRPSARTAVLPWISARWRLLLLAALVNVLLLGYLARQLLYPDSGARVSIAVIGFRNLNPNPATQWLSDALAEVFIEQLRAGHTLRTISADNIARFKYEMPEISTAELGPFLLSRVHRRLEADLVLSGTYLLNSTGQLRVDIRLHEARRGQVLMAAAVDGSYSNIRTLVAPLAAQVREKTGAGQITATEAAQANAALPSVPEATKLYAEGLRQLRAFDTTAAQVLLERAVAAENDSALAHSALAEAYSRLGYDPRAAAEAKRAVELSSKLSQEDRLLIEARYQQFSNSWDQAVGTYTALFTLSPDEFEYGWRLGEALIRAGRAKDALATAVQLQKLSRDQNDPRVLLLQASAFAGLSDFKEQEAKARAAVEASAALGAKFLEAQARDLLGTALWRLGNPTPGLEQFRAARHTYEAIGDMNAAARESVRIAKVLYDQGNLQAAETVYQEAIGRYRSSGDRLGTVTTLNSIGLVQWQQGRLADAEQSFSQGLALAREIEDINTEPKLLGNLALVFEDYGNLSKARKYHEEAVTAFLRVGNRGQAANEMNNLATVLHALGELDRAEEFQKQAQEAATKSGAKRILGFVLSASGELLAARGKLGAARENHNRALEAWRSMGSDVEAEYDEVALVGLDMEEGRTPSVEKLHEAIARFRAAEATPYETSARLLLAELLLKQGNVSQAQTEIEQANSLAKTAEGRLKVNLARARLLLVQNDLQGARQVVNKALGDTRRLGYVNYGLAARLTLAEIILKTDRRTAIADLQRLRQEADQKGFGLVARKCAALTGRGSTSP